MSADKSQGRPRRGTHMADGECPICGMVSARAIPRDENLAEAKCQNRVGISGGSAWTNKRCGTIYGIRPIRNRGAEDEF